MKIWKILSPKVLTCEEKPDNITAETQAKVKVTSVLVTGEELRAFDGSAKVKYPLVPGRFAVGIVGETGAGCVGVEKNARVYLHDAAPCGECARCAAGDTDACADMRIAGFNRGGYLREFVVADECTLSPLPASVSDEEALFIGVVSLCENIIGRLGVTKGMHVAVIGADEIGNILAQLLIYHQAVPVLIDADDEKLAAAAQCGIYYTLKADASLGENISRITGGRSAAGSVYCSFCGLPSDLPFGITAAGGTVVYAGLSFPETTAPLKAALDKRLTLTAVTGGCFNYAAAINLLVNKAVNLAPLRLQKKTAAQAAEYFASESEKGAKGGRMPFAVFNML